MAAYAPPPFRADHVGSLLRPPALLDARDARRYAGEMAEPRPGIESGHIPGSLSMPFADLLDHDTGLMFLPAVLKEKLGRLALPEDRKIACTCGSGVTACVVALALHETGVRDAAVYDGSWTEWGGTPELPKKKGTTP